MTAAAEHQAPIDARSAPKSPYGAPSGQNRVPAVDANFLGALDRLLAEERAGRLPAPRDPGILLDRASGLSGRLALELFESAVAARHLDFEARQMKARGEGFYTIGSAGHEGNASVAAALRPDDPALLHYRSGPFYAQRGKQRPGESPTFDILLSLAASAEDPISGGRHKVFGSATLAIPPQTSTIASHLPKALGLAVGLDRARKIGRAPRAGEGKPLPDPLRLTAPAREEETPSRPSRLKAPAREEETPSRPSRLKAPAREEETPSRPSRLKAPAREEETPSRPSRLKAPAREEETPSRPSRLKAPFAADAIVLCSMGDASVNHATAQTAFNAARWFAYQGIPAPVLFVSEDNGIGISVDTPLDWVRAAFEAGPRGPDGLPLMAFFEGDGRSIASSYAAARAAARHVRATRRPGFLRLRTVRLMGHAGSDIETTYRTLPEMEADEARDPLQAWAEELCRAGVARPGDLRAIYEETRVRVAAGAREASRRRKLESAAEVMTPLCPLDAEAVDAEARRPAPAAERVRLFGGEAGLPERSAKPKHLGAILPQALLEIGAKYDGFCLFGEDVAKKGGVYHATADLQKRLGKDRVFDTLLDETSILGLGMGFAQAGLLPSPEIQYLAYVHNALDQIRGEACSLQYFSNDRYRNPMVVRIAGLGYQKGFGGHFHNDNSTAALRDIPGLIIGCPSRGDDAVGMLRTLFAAASVSGRVSIFLEPIALYMQKDLLAKDDEGWCARYPAEGHAVPIGKARAVRLRSAGTERKGAGIDGFLEDLAEGSTGPDGDALTIVTYGNGMYLSARAARTLEERHGVRARLLDLRWLLPLDREAILLHARATGRVLVVDEGRRSGGVAEPVMALLAEAEGAGAVKCARVSGLDTYIPLAAAALLCMPSEADVVAAALALVC